MKKICTLLLALSSSVAFAALTPLDNQSLQAIEGQAGADLSLKLVLNQNKLTNAELLDPTKKPLFTCVNLAFCHLAVSPNKRFVQKDASGNWNVAASDPTSANPGHKLWLVFKGLQGTVNIQKLALDGADLVYMNKSGQATLKPAIQLGFDAALPIQIRNLGFNSVSIEQDDFASYYDAGGNLVEGTGTPGYLVSKTYTAIPQSTGATGTTADNYDLNREKGFMGLQMNGNLAIQGQVMMFSCDGTHPRC